MCTVYKPCSCKKRAKTRRCKKKYLKKIQNLVFCLASPTRIDFPKKDLSSQIQSRRYRSKSVFINIFCCLNPFVSGHPVPTLGQDDDDIHLIIFNAHRHRLREPQILPLTIILFLSGVCASAVRFLVFIGPVEKCILCVCSRRVKKPPPPSALTPAPIHVTRCCCIIGTGQQWGPHDDGDPCQTTGALVVVLQ